MKLNVAVLLVLTMCSSGAVTQGQSPSRKASQGATKPKAETIRICQGLPVPDGYVIIAYMTSAACVHGAYLLKKQDDYENSLAVNGSARQPDEASDASAPVAPASSKSNSPVRKTGTQTARRSGSAANSSGSQSRQTQSATKSNAPGTASASVTRPRVVGAAAQNTGRHRQLPWRRRSQLFLPQ